MTITYKLENNLEKNLISVFKKVDGNQVMSIPLDSANTDYQEFLQWKADGGVPDAAD